MTDEDARRIAEKWISAWNRRDLDAIMDHYAPDAHLTSPMVVRRLGLPGGTIEDREQLQSYFAQGLRVAPQLHFELRKVLTGVDGIAVYYVRETGAEVVDVMTLDEQARAVRVQVFYHSPVP